jgi:U3 small nucleolar RNA-associated protein 12
MMKVWDLGTQHCVETVIAHRGEVWSLEVLPTESTSESESAATHTKKMTVITGGSEGEVRVWKLDPVILASKLESTADGAVDGSFSSHDQVNSGVFVNGGEESSSLPTTHRAITSHGLLERQSKERVVTIKAHGSGKYLCVQVRSILYEYTIQSKLKHKIQKKGADRLVEIYKIRTESEIRKRLARLKRRIKEKKKTDDVDNSNAAATQMDIDETPTLTTSDEIPRIYALRCSAKIRSIDLSPKPTTSSTSSSSSEDAFQILCSLTTNQIEVYTAGLDSKEEPTRQNLILDSFGHRADIRSLALSSDDATLLSGSHSSVKLWNLSTRRCIATMDSGYALCSLFVPGNNHVVVGTKAGDLEVFDLQSCCLIERVKAHDGPVWSMQMWPDRKGLTTGSADKDVKFWEFGIKTFGRDGDEEEGDDAGGRKVLTLVHTRTLKLSDDVLCVRHSHDGQYLAVALLDCTVKVFYADTLKFFLSLYGHKLPVLCMDISSDGTLIATGSADKTVKIWGLDFGDCHRSLFAHADSVMCCRFVFGTHYIITAGKDKVVKQWDADKVCLVISLFAVYLEFISCFVVFIV